MPSSRRSSKKKKSKSGRPSRVLKKRGSRGKASDARRRYRAAGGESQTPDLFRASQGAGIQQVSKDKAPFECPQSFKLLEKLATLQEVRSRVERRPAYENTYIQNFLSTFSTASDIRMLPEGNALKSLITQVPVAQISENVWLPGLRKGFERAGNAAGEWRVVVKWKLVYEYDSSNIEVTITDRFPEKKACSPTRFGVEITELGHKILGSPEFSRRWGNDIVFTRETDEPFLEYASRLQREIPIAVSDFQKRVMTDVTSMLSKVFTNRTADCITSLRSPAAPSSSSVPPFSWPPPSP